MSEQKIAEALLKGHYGPAFPSTLKPAQKRFRYHAERMWQQLFDEVAHALSRGRVRMHPKTSDGYVWAASISFEFERVRVKVLIPMMHDSSKADGSYADRHLAIHTEGAIMDGAFHERAGRHFATVFSQEYRAKYGRAIAESKKTSQTE